MTARRTSSWSLAQVSSQARKMFLIALPFGVLFWAYGIGGTGEDGRAWFNLPMVISGLAFAIWMAASAIEFFRRNA